MIQKLRSLLKLIVAPLASRSSRYSEVRSYEVEHVLQLLHLNFHHGSRKVVTRSGTYLKPLLVGFIDDRSRFLCHAQWYTTKAARS
jgi:putative transposase